MKKSTFLFIALFTVSAVFAQSFKAQFKSANKTWLGIDYTAAKFIGSEGFNAPTELPGFAYKWNQFVFSEADKYNLKKAFYSQNVTINLEQVNERNAKIDGPGNVQETDYTMSEEEAQKIALSYDFSELEGVAIMLVTESYNKLSQKGTYWLVIVDVATKEVIYTKKYVCKAGGFGFKNYWARTFYEALNDIEDDMKRALK